MTKLLLSLSLPFALLPLVAQAQPGAVNPPLLGCGQQGEATIVCGTRAPEDFEVTPDGNYLIIANFGQGTDPSLDLFNVATQQFSTLALSDEHQAGWGQAACTTSIGAKVSPHGLSLTQRTGGAWQFYVVNHSERESMEMYELQQDGASWKLVWRGCVMADKPYNDVAALPDGSFVATRPTATQKEGQDIFAGAPSGNVAVWTAAAGETVLPGTEYGYPNGVSVSKDGRYAYVSGWTTKSFHKYDLTQKQEVGRGDFSFMPDNLTWTADGKLLAAGIKGVAGNCPATSADPCIQGFGVAEIDPATLKVTEIYDNAGKALINGVSVAIEADGAIYVGSFQGDRLVKLPR
ncbi:MAG: SMP-30/gluconolactonase/LRE family protein [Pseudomonadota bacterium]